MDLWEIVFVITVIIVLGILSENEDLFFGLIVIAVFAACGGVYIAVRWVIDVITYRVFGWCVVHKWERHEEIGREDVVWGRDGLFHGYYVSYREVCRRCDAETVSTSQTY